MVKIRDKPYSLADRPTITVVSVMRSLTAYEKVSEAESFDFGCSRLRKQCDPIPLALLTDPSWGSTSEEYNSEKIRRFSKTGTTVFAETVRTNESDRIRSTPMDVRTIIEYVDVPYSEMSSKFVFNNDG